MKVILKGNDLIKKMISTSNFFDDDVYVPSKFILFSDDEYCLAHNTLTKALILINDEEKQLLQKESLKFEENLIPFIELGFLVKKGTDEVKSFEQVKSTFSLFNKKEKGIRTYTILTTTDCNARCFYCYEAGIKKTFMSKETAQKVVEYIKNNHCGNEVTLSWFGGEPLYNSEVIDIICEGLKKNNIKFISKMTSNGYLFDDDLVKKSKELWNLVRVQITLDGTEEVYNKCKNYIYEDGKSPFNIVCNNIQRLIDNQIYVNIRMNMDEHNKDDLYDLVEYINKRYPNKDYLIAYVSLLFDHDATQRTINEKISLAKVRNQLSNLLFDYNLGSGYIKQKMNNFNCLADSDSSVIINPLGELGRCEHFVYDDVYSTIFEPEKVDQNIVLAWKEPRPRIEDCKSCPIMPSCFTLKKCPEASRECDEADRIIFFDNFRRRMKNEFRNYNKKNREQ